MADEDKVFFKLFELQARKGDLKKYEIVCAAIECIGEMGIQNLTFQAIGTKLGIGKSHVVYHFPTIEQIVENAVKYTTAVAQQITIEKIGKAKDWRGQVRGYVEGAFIWCEKHPDQASLMMAFFHLCTHQNQYRELHEKIRTVGQQRLAAVLERHLKPKSKAAEKARLLSMAIQSMITGNIVEAISCKGSTAIHKLREDTVQAVMLILQNAE